MKLKDLLYSYLICTAPSKHKALMTNLCEGFIHKGQGKNPLLQPAAETHEGCFHTAGLHLVLWLLQSFSKKSVCAPLLTPRSQKSWICKESVQRTDLCSQLALFTRLGLASSLPTPHPCPWSQLPAWGCLMCWKQRILSLSWEQEGCFSSLLICFWALSDCVFLVPIS